MLKALLRKSKKNQKGFTLIELLAVIVILAILAAIAIPSVMAIISKQNQKATVSDALNAIQAAKLYVADHNVSTTTTLKSTQLAPYISKVSGSKGAAAENFTVTVNYDGSTSTATYSISGLPTINGLSATSGTGTSATYAESTLVAFNRGN
ncbi:MAG: prepilin-type N-terminal cleavage/methylation domain-containing protein [Sporolactobacillus sp.]